VFILSMSAFFILTFGTLGGMVAVMIDRLLRSWKINLPDLAHAILVPCVIALVIAYIIGWGDDKQVIFWFGFLSIVFAFLNLPALAIRRVERFERALHSKGVSVLNSRQARKRLMLVLPFIINPATAFFFLKVLFAKGDMIYGNKRPLKAIEDVDLGDGWVDGRFCRFCNRIHVGTCPTSLFSLDSNSNWID